MVPILSAKTEQDESIPISNVMRKLQSDIIIAVLNIYRALMETLVPLTEPVMSVCWL